MVIWGESIVMSVDYKDYYKILEVERSASADDIQKSYKKLARKYHPDLNQGDKAAEEKFKDIGEAYEVLKDPQTRAQYDALGANWKHGQSFTPPPGWGGFDFGQGAQNIHFNVGGANGMSDFFKLLMSGLGGLGGMGGGPGMGGFGGMGGGPGMGGFGGMGGGPGMGGFGGMGGAGASQSASAEAPVIDLNLSVLELLDDAPKSITITQNHQTRSLKVNIPKGAKDKTIFKLKGQSIDGGDLRVRVNIVDDECRTDEFDIIQKLKVTPWEAALGTQLECSTIVGNVKLTIPPGVQSGQKLRLPEKGLFKKSGRGDLMMEIQICVPKDLTSEEKKLFEKLAKKSEFNPR
jgi:curved DNA-binding protein